MLGAFTIGFEKVLKSCLLLLAAFPGLIDTFVQLVAMIVCDVATKVLGTELFPQHSIADLISVIAFIFLFSQEKPSPWKEINTHIHTSMNFSIMVVFVNIEFFSGLLMPAHLSYENFGNLASKNCDHFDIFQSMKNSNLGWKTFLTKALVLLNLISSHVTLVRNRILR